MVIFRIHENVGEMNERGGGTGAMTVPAMAPPPTEPGPAVATA
jgi:hypothetical protein